MPDPSLHTLAEVAEADHVGFTGTRRGMTFVQRRRLRDDVLWPMQPSDFDHGDCIGSDAQSHPIAILCGAKIHLRPSLVTSLRAFCEIRTGVDTFYSPKPPLVRNRDIVDASKVLIATPGEMTEQLRSGTWSTIRYARKHGRRVIIIFPDGSVRDSAEGRRG